MSDQSVAALDVGSNTIRLLVAQRSNGGLTTIHDESEFVRLGAGVDQTGQLAADRIGAAIVAIDRLKQRAEQAGASQVLAVATSAVRDAVNGRDFARSVQELTGVEVQIISGTREAELTYLGATLGLTIKGDTIVCDLGGGSAEIIAASPAGMRWEHSLPLGSGRLAERYIHHDPPTPQERQNLAHYVVSLLERLPRDQPELIVFTGGTASHVAWLGGVDGVTGGVTIHTIGQVVEVVSAMSADEVVHRYGVKPERAKVLPAGVTALRAVASFYQPKSLVITQHGIREGVVVEYLRARGDWSS